MVYISIDSVIDEWSELADLEADNWLHRSKLTTRFKEDVGWAYLYAQFTPPKHIDVTQTEREK